MDAGFHLTRKSLIEDGSLARAEEAYSSDEALAILKSLPCDILLRLKAEASQELDRRSIR